MSVVEPSRRAVPEQCRRVVPEQCRRVVPEPSRRATHGNEARKRDKIPRKINRSRRTRHCKKTNFLPWTCFRILCRRKGREALHHRLDRFAALQR
ncbi:MAG: hypothetical protein II957_09020 [Treponema sp.]|nr:hypothetical protein [Treponema sp.]